ncbi:hypothetical protein F5884DRAFT_421496 [Xylogone sp. PMI_703]|nr:hypothetical protein F5884DRAFT_421496 [Xylogone sp. PMI_703]
MDLVQNIDPASPSIAIEVGLSLPVPQQYEIRDAGEDWTGKSNWVLRRKLQNRLNQRARRRRKQDKLNPYPSVANVIQPPGFCMHPISRLNVIRAASFSSFASSNMTPLSSDHYLLTLLHFNLVRAMTENILRLGINPDRMADDIPSPFVDGCGNLTSHSDSVSNKHISSFPPLLRPTQVQRTIPHHPEYDILPSARLRDNIILQQDTFDDVELCLDMIYGVDFDPTLDRSNLLSRVKEHSDECRVVTGGTLGGRTGLIVWSDPSLPGSWEVDEAFARKWKRLFVGCEELLRSTNFWREKRGEKKLVLDF